MKPSIQSKARQRGFALIVTLSLMILLTVVAVGLLSLSAISLRTASAAEVNGRAYANARMAMMMALGELQNHTGDDRRITADASIFTTAVQSHMVGAWTSWSPNLAVTPDQAGPDYSKEKTAHFRSWLSSSPDPAASKDPNWADKALGSDAVRLFSNSRDGFALSAQRVPIANGSFAWAVSQEGTKAKVNIAGPDASPTTGNIGLQAQARPSLSQSKSLKDLTDGWNKRASRLLSFNQIQLDKDLCPDPTAFRAEGGSYTPHSQGLLADVVKGGLKTDLNLGFEMSDSDFALDSWGATKNPFRSVGTNSGVVSPSTYKGQQPLFKPLTDNPIVANTLSYSPATLDNRFFAAGVPTFDHLRSFYRIPRHLYGGSSPVVAERGAGHVAIKVAAASSGSYLSPSNPPTAAESKLAIRPVLDRVVYLLGSALGADGEVRLIMTPAISLWNPYNVALESEGAVAFQWMDAPFRVNWYFKNAAGTSKKYGPLSAIMAKQFSGQGRSINPYFFCEITADGNGNISKPIHFEPGEVRLFVPASNTPVDFVRKGSNAQRTVRLRAVNDISEMNIKGGIAIPMKPGNSAEGFSYVVQPNDETQTTFQAFGNGNYNYFVSLEDAARIKNPADSTRGEAIGEVQSVKFLSSEDEVKSAYYSVAELKNGTQPFGVLETYHRTAKQTFGGQPFADLVYTTNPRQSAINHQLSAGSFTSAPHFQSTLRSVSSFEEAVQTTIDGRDLYWGSSQSSSGRTHLPFFEIPRQPMLSLAGFQHADLASSTYSASNQFANSWANPYLAGNLVAALNKTYSIDGVPIYDSVYLTNEALWDGFFFSGAAPELSPASTGNPSTAWNSPIANETRSLKTVLTEFIANPENSQFPNSRMRLIKGSSNNSDLLNDLLSPAGCTRIAAHLMVDGAFNVNSTDIEAWVAVLCGMRGKSFDVDGGSPPSGNVTAFPRFRFPTGSKDDNWNGFRTLDDGQIRKLAETLVTEVRSRGPFLSLAEFVNRRVDSSALAKTGAIQASIDKLKFNDQSMQDPFLVSNYPTEAQPNIQKDTGVGIPGYLTQADVLQSIAPVITVRSDTFTIRSYGEAKDGAGKVIGRAWCEAVVQRLPDFIDRSNAAETPLASTTPVNKTFGRRYEIISFRQLPSSEIQ